MGCAATGNRVASAEPQPRAHVYEAALPTAAAAENQRRPSVCPVRNLLPVSRAHVHPLTLALTLHNYPPVGRAPGSLGGYVWPFECEPHTRCQCPRHAPLPRCRGLVNTPTGAFTHVLLLPQMPSPAGNICQPFKVQFATPPSLASKVHRYFPSTAPCTSP